MAFRVAATPLAVMPSNVIGQWLLWKGRAVVAVGQGAAANVVFSVATDSFFGSSAEFVG